MKKPLTRLAFTLAACLGIGATALAQDFLYPLKPITVLVPSDGGGRVDKTAQLLVDGIVAETKKKVVLQSVKGQGPDGAMLTAIQMLKKAPPDGYTLLLTSYEMSQSAQKDLAAVTALAEFEPAAGVASTASLLVINANLPYKTLSDFMAAAKESPGRFKCASATPPSSSSLVGADFERTWPGLVKFESYPNVTKAVAGVVAGQSDCMFELAYPLMHGLLSGKLKSMATTGSSRQAETPRTPTFKEAIGTDFVSSSWYGVHAPKGTSDMVLRRISQGVSMSISRPDVQKAFGDMGYGVSNQDRDDFRKSIENDVSPAKSPAPSKAIAMLDTFAFAQ